MTFPTANSSSVPTAASAVASGNNNQNNYTDEIPALVMDVGSHSVRAGYCNEDSPRAVFSSRIGHLGDDGGDIEMTGTNTAGNKRSLLFGETAQIWRENLEINSAFNPQTGLVGDWDLYESLWSYALSRRMRVLSEEFPLLLVEPSHNTPEQRAKQAELAFERFKVPAFYLGKTGVMSAFAAGRSTALVVDCGASNTSIIPVYDGYVVKKGVITQPLAGNFLSDQLKYLLEEQLKIPVIPQFKIHRRRQVEEGQPADYVPRKLQNCTGSFELFAVQRAIDDVKETLCAVSDIRFDEKSLLLRPQKSYEFPNGFNKTFGPDRFRIPEILFNPKGFIASVRVLGLFLAAVSTCDVDLRPQLLGNIVLAGGSTLFQNFGDRINNELFSMLPGSKIRLYASGSSAERRFSNWIGGSILGSLGTFHQLWISKQEYEEHGANILEKRCP